MTSFTIAIEIICSIFGIPFPLWVVTAEFGYFMPPYFVQIIATFVVWSSVALFFMSTVPSLFVTVCPVSLPLCFAGAVIGGLVVAGLVFRGMARFARRRLLRHSVWLRSAGD